MQRKNHRPAQSLRQAPPPLGVSGTNPTRATAVETINHRLDNCINILLRATVVLSSELDRIDTSPPNPGTNPDEISTAVNTSGMVSMLELRLNALCHQITRLDPNFEF